MQENVDQENVVIEENLEKTEMLNNENIVINISEDIAVIENKINNISSISPTPTSEPEPTPIVTPSQNEEKDQNNIYTGRIEFSEFLSQRDNLIIRQLKAANLSQPNANAHNKELPKITIPKKIFQTHKSIEFIRNSPKLRNAMDSWRRHSKDFEYYFYTDEVCDKFMKENFEGDVYEAYTKLPLKVMKADLWRYCIIYKYGGIYADADTICYINPNILLKNAQIVCAPESDENYLCQWTFAAPPESPVLKSIIDLSVKRILANTSFKDKNIVHFLTGPQVFTDGIEKYLLENSIKLFRAKTDYIKYSNKISQIFAFEKNIFHKRMIKHLFAGFDNNGWKRQRDTLVEYNRLMS